MRLMLLAALLFALLATPFFAEAAGWVLIAPPKDKNGDYVRNAPVNDSWTQIAAFDNAAQCEEQRMAEINSWRRQLETAPFLKQRWLDEFLIRCMPYDLWWRAQQPPR
jgi:hypothetical protein